MADRSPCIAIPAREVGSCFWGVPHTFWGDLAWKGGSGWGSFLWYPAGGGDVQVIPHSLFLSEAFNVLFCCTLALSITQGFGGGSPQCKTFLFMFAELDAGKAGTVWCLFSFSCFIGCAMSRLSYGGKTGKTSYHSCKSS